MKIFLPEPPTSLFDPTAINLETKALELFSLQQYRIYEETYSPKAYDNLCKVTQMQALSNSWMLHRTERFTASTYYQVSETKLDNPSKSLIEKIMQYEASLSNSNEYTSYGKKYEPDAKTNYLKIMKKLQTNAEVVDTGFHVRAISPFLGASPDGLVSCSCHPKRVLEIKCPFKYQRGFKGWENDKDFPITSKMKIKLDHKYYYQI